MNKVLGTLFFGFSLFLSIKTNISNLLFVLILVGALIQFFLNKKREQINFSSLWASTAPIFILSLIGLIWSFNVENGLHILGKQAGLIMIPASFLFFDKPQIIKYKNYTFKGLLSGVFLASVALLIHNAYQIFNTSEFKVDRIFSSFYTSHRYTSLLDSLDPSYLGIYSIIALSIVLLKGITMKKSLRFLFIAIVSLNVIFINARIIFLLLFLLIVYRIALLDSLKKKLWIGGVFLFSVVISVFALRNTYVFKKAVTGTFWELSYNVGTSNTTDKIKSDSRLARWNCALDEGNKKLLIGSGFGTEMDVLLSCYEKNNMQVALERKFNTHNQFLSYFVTLGLIGVLVYIFLFWKGIKQAWKERDRIALFFFVALFVMSLVENIMARNAGIIFLAMYVSLFNSRRVS